jgi:hypothetical protein
MHHGGHSITDQTMPAWNLMKNDSVRKAPEPTPGIRPARTHGFFKVVAKARARCFTMRAEKPQGRLSLSHSTGFLKSD